MFRIVLIGIILVMFGTAFVSTWLQTPVAQGVSVVTKTQTQTGAPQQLPTTSNLPITAPQTVLQLFPNPALPDSQGHIDVDVSINTNGNKVTAAQFTLHYDPTALKFVSIEPDDAFYNATVVTKTIDETQGLITYGLQLSSQQANQPVQGNDHIAEVEFRAVHSGQTNVKFVSAQVNGVGTSTSVLQSTQGTVVKMHY